MREAVSGPEILFIRKDPMLRGFLTLNTQSILTLTNRVLMAHTEWLPGGGTEMFSTTCAVHIVNCEGWWLPGYHGSVAEHCPGFNSQQLLAFLLSSIFAS